MADSKDVDTALSLPTGTHMWPLKRYTEIHRKSLEDPRGILGTRSA